MTTFDEVTSGLTFDEEDAQLLAEAEVIPGAEVLQVPEDSVFGVLIEGRWHIVMQGSFVVTEGEWHSDDAPQFEFVPDCCVTPHPDQDNCSCCLIHSGPLSSVQAVKVL